MGCATSFSGEGIVGGHAYSILDVIEISDAVLGGQKSVSDFYSSQENSLYSNTFDLRYIRFEYVFLQLRIYSYTNV